MYDSDDWMRMIIMQAISSRCLHGAITSPIGTVYAGCHHDNLED